MEKTEDEIDKDIIKPDEVTIPIIKDKKPFIWYDKEEKYLKMLCLQYNEESEDYMKLYKKTFRVQCGLRLPAIALSSVAGIASFGTASFPTYAQRYVGIGVGIVNIFIAMLQTYESYFKVNDVVVKALNVSYLLKKLSNRIHCELCIPIESRSSNGDEFLRNTYNDYEKIMADAPPLVDKIELKKNNRNNYVIDENDNNKVDFLNDDHVKLHENITKDIDNNYTKRAKMIVEEVDHNPIVPEKISRKILNI